MRPWHHIPGQFPPSFLRTQESRPVGGSQGQARRDRLLCCDEGDTPLHAVIPAEAGIHG